VSESEGVELDRAEELLLEAEFEDCRTLWYSSNYVYLARLCAGNGETFAAVYKPQKGEAPLWDFPGGTLYRREAAAYRLSRLLGWTFIPPTVVRDGPHGIGSVQLFISHDQTSSFFEQREVPALVPQLKRMVAFDYIANNADRKGGHCLLDESQVIWGIDHGLCFHEQYKMRSVAWDWADTPIAKPLLRDIAAGREAMVAGTEVAQRVTDLLSAAEGAAIVDRMTALLERKRFPLPGPHRHYPWPLV
jgi:uncharacterized repeat protein (TIGR03843 family)